MPCPILCQDLKFGICMWTLIVYVPLFTYKMTIYILRKLKKDLKLLLRKKKFSLKAEVVLRINKLVLFSVPKARNTPPLDIKRTSILFTKLKHAYLI